MLVYNGFGTVPGLRQASVGNGAFTIGFERSGARRRRGAAKITVWNAFAGSRGTPSGRKTAWFHNCVGRVSVAFAGFAMV